MSLADTALIETLVARYAGAGRFAMGFVRGKLGHDPATAALFGLSEGGFGHLLDLGCGRGQMGLALLLAGRASRLTGIDRAGPRIAEATIAAHGLPARFEAAELSRAELPGCDTAMLIDVLYQMPESTQLALLKRVAAVARRRVLIRALDPDRGWRSGIALAMESAGRWLRGEVGRAAIAPLPLERLAAPLREAGFHVRVSPCWGRTPLANVMVIAERP